MGNVMWSGGLLVSCLPVLALSWRWRWQPTPERRMFWQRAVLLALIPLGIASVQVVQAPAAPGPMSPGPVWLSLVTLWAVGASYLLTLIRTDDLDADDTGPGDLGAHGAGDLDMVSPPLKAFGRLLLTSLLATTVALLLLSPPLQFFVSVTTMVFLGMHQPLSWHQRYTLPVVAVFVWMFSFASGSPPRVLDALSNATGLIITAAFGLLLRRFRHLVLQMKAANLQLSAQAAQAEELAILRERARLARELHDTLGHALTTITVQLEAAELSLERRPDKVRTLLSQSRELSRAATSELRLSLSDLRSEGTRSIREQLGALIGPGGSPDVHLDLTDVQLSPQQEQALVRIAGEAVQNARRHAHARQIRVKLCQTPQDTWLSVRDDGQGFDPGRPIAPGHYGLNGMRERLVLLGGHLEIVSAPGEGTRVVARLPRALALKESPV
ncbi:sensor histidine kinase [Deinococcus altitudinis]|uniref:sensor histidine kinase n=1 Tax=Deinococcus altitudinis TaxID=468914 RepID=UPI0038915A0A